MSGEIEHLGRKTVVLHKSSRVHSIQGIIILGEPLQDLTDQVSQNRLVTWLKFSSVAEPIRRSAVRCWRCRRINTTLTAKEVSRYKIGENQPSFTELPDT